MVEIVCYSDLVISKMVRCDGSSLVRCEKIIICGGLLNRRFFYQWKKSVDSRKGEKEDREVETYLTLYIFPIFSSYFC